MRRLLKRALAAAALLIAALSAFTLIDAWEAFGGAPTGARLERMVASPQWSDGIFVNPQPMWNDYLGMFTTMGAMSPVADPEGPLPVQSGDRSRFASPPETGLRITWLGHSTTLLEIDGAIFLTDPIFGGRAAPVDWAGPATWYAPPIPLSELPPLDAVLISHDHYDHLQMDTIKALAASGASFVAPLGVGAHLEAWGVDPSKISEVDWWDRLEIEGIELVSTPARHASGRQAFDQNRTLWTGYALLGPAHRIYFTGDTGLFPDLLRIGEELGPFDVTLPEIGAYNQAWPDWHLGPEQAVRAHQMARGELMVPAHWGMMNLASHGWTEPIERVMAEAERRGVDVFAPRPGESFEPGAPTPGARWWPELPWRTAAEDPIVATKVPPE